MVTEGCIWQAQDASVPSRILQGIAESQAYGCRPSEMGSATLWSGDVIVHRTRRAKQYVPKALYTEHAVQIALFADVRI